MILTDREILASLLGGLISIDPQPAFSAYSSTSVDLTLAPEISLFRSVGDLGGEVIDPAGKGFCHRAMIARLTRPAAVGPDGLVLASGAMALGWTRERIDLKAGARVAARVEGKSSLARFGLAVHVTAPTIHAGFSGAIQLEFVNHGPAAIRLRPGMRICQLILEQTIGVPERGYAGQFQHQGPHMAKTPRGSSRGLAGSAAGTGGSDRRTA